MDIEVTMPGGSGITVPRPITSISDFNLRVPKAPVDIAQKLPHVLEAIRLIKSKLDGKVPLIGFSAAPWTLMFYLLGGSSRSNQQRPASWFREHPKESRELLNILTRMVVDYLSAQVEAGADLLQVFEAMGENISEPDFNEWALPCLVTIARELKRRHPAVPLMVFPRGASYSLEELQSAGYDVVTLDTATDRGTILQRLQRAAELSTHLDGRSVRAATIQGNFDVRLLNAASGGTVETVRREAGRMLQELGPQGLIANLGEGLTGAEDPALVAAFVDAVHELSAGTLV